jgi:hypothetical protein
MAPFRRVGVCDAQSSDFQDSRPLYFVQKRSVMVAIIKEETTTTIAIVRSSRCDLLWKSGITPSGGGPHGIVHRSTSAGSCDIVKILASYV